MNSIIYPLEIGHLVVEIDKRKVSDCTIKVLIKEALAELAESPLDGEDFNLVVDAFVSHGLL